MRGGIPIGQIIAKLEANPGRANQLAAARRAVASAFDATETIRVLRLRAGLSQTLLAQLAGTTQSHIARIESGATDPHTDTIERLAEALGVDEARLFGAVRAQRRSRVRDK